MGAATPFLVLENVEEMAKPEVGGNRTWASSARRSSTARLREVRRAARQHAPKATMAQVEGAQSVGPEKDENGNVKFLCEAARRRGYAIQTRFMEPNSGEGGRCSVRVYLEAPQASLVACGIYFLSFLIAMTSPIPF